jgi:ATP-binding cassette, subfamily B, bacterial MsbA
MFRQPRSRPRPAEPTPAAPPAQPLDWRRLLHYLHPYRRQMLLAILMLAGSSAVNLGFPLLIVQLLESVLNQQNSDLLNQLALTLCGVFFLQALFTFGQSYLLNVIGERIIVDLRITLYRQLQRLSLDFFANHRVGELISRISSDVTQVRAVLTSNITQLLSSLVSLIGSVTILFLLNQRLVGFVFTLALAIVVVAATFGRLLQRLSTRVQDELAGATVAVEEGLQGIRVVKSFAREQYEIARYKGAMQRTLSATLRLVLLRSAFGGLMAFLGFSGIAAILWLSGQEILAGRLSFATISGFLIYAITIGASLGQLSGLYGQFREALGSVHRVFEILDTQPSVTDAADAVDLHTIDGSIRFNDVSFAYETDRDVLHNLNFSVRPGEVVALVGPSGAGKSTIFNLIPRFYDPTHGSVAIDDLDLRTVTQLSLRSQIGLVPQETMLFGGTIRENIAYGRLDAGDEEIIAAAKAANAHDFITATASGYQTVVGERGLKLSGGQRQRIAIARAMLKDPRILLLDEATSSLDSESESLVQEALERLMQGRTAVIIAHRLSTIAIAHRIIVIDQGRVVEEGSHTELLARHGIYARLYALQFRELDNGSDLPPAAA